MTLSRVRARERLRKVAASVVAASVVAALAVAALAVKVVKVVNFGIFR